jgi:hypothetical protein
MAVARSFDALRAPTKGDRAFDIDPSASSYAIMRRTCPYRGGNSGPGRTSDRSLKTSSGIREQHRPTTDSPRGFHASCQSTRRHAAGRAANQKQRRPHRPKSRAPRRTKFSPRQCCKNVERGSNKCCRRHSHDPSKHNVGRHVPAHCRHPPRGAHANDRPSNRVRGRHRYPQPSR